MIYDKDYISDKSIDMQDENLTGLPSPPAEKGKSKTPTSTLHSKRPSKERSETPLGDKAKPDQSPVSLRSRKVEDKSLQDTSV